MVVLVKQEFLEQHYTQQKCAKHIRIKVNTAPATADKPTPVIQPRDSIFPNLEPLCPPALCGSQDEADRLLRQQIIDRKMTEICKRRPRSSTLDAVRDAPKVPWNEYESGKSGGRSQPDWTPLTKPFTTYGVPDNHAWWMDGGELRSEMIKQWNDEHTVEEIISDLVFIFKVVQQASISNPMQDPANAKAGRDFHSLPALSETYATDRNDEWYEENVKPAMAEALDKAAHKFAEDQRAAKRIQGYVANLADQVRRNPSDRRLRVIFEDMQNNLRVAKWEMEKSQKQLDDSRKDYRTAKDPSVAAVGVPEVDIVNLPPLERLLKCNKLAGEETSRRRDRLERLRNEIKQTNKNLPDEWVALARQNNAALYGAPQTPPTPPDWHERVKEE